MVTVAVRRAFDDHRLHRENERLRGVTYENEQLRNSEPVVETNLAQRAGRYPAPPGSPRTWP